ncbi:MAG TPA: SDR family NAD(P)-dependent oxidoreductase [Dehalococcoidales bacterium]|nr:SDR family NAD(P)-dependent oxidoreductase [Dehalococcoidales bacterium]
MLLENKVAIVTGGAKGIGRGIALKFAREGCDVVVNALHIEGAEKVADEIRAMGRRSLAIKADISNSAEVNDMVDETIKQFGKIDILVNNAGGVMGVQGGNTDTATEEDWDRVLSVNLKGAFLVCMAVIPHMKKNKYGKIVNLSSMGAVHPSVSVLHYHAAKAGILGLTLNLAFELAPFNIYVNAIVPGPIETPFWDALQPPGPERDAFLAALAKKEIPLGRTGTPDDIAGPALFLASGLSDYVTGQIIYAAGGQPLSSHASTFLSSTESSGG